MNTPKGTIANKQNSVAPVVAGPPASDEHDQRSDEGRKQERRGDEQLLPEERGDLTEVGL